MTKNEYDDLNKGDVVRHKVTGANYVIGSTYGAVPKENLKDIYEQYIVVMKVVK